MRRIFTISATILSCLCAAMPTTARADEVVLMTTGAVEQIMKGLIPSFERGSGHTVNMSVFGTGPAVAKIKDGTFADLILLGPDALGACPCNGVLLDDEARVRFIVFHEQDLSSVGHRTTVAFAALCS